MKHGFIKWNKQLILFIIVVTSFSFLFVPSKIHAKDNDIYKDGMYVYKITSEEDKTVSLIGIESPYETNEVLIPGNVTIQGASYTVEEVRIEYSYYENIKYEDFYKNVEKVNIAENFIGTVQNLNYGFPKFNTMEFYGHITPKAINVEIPNSDEMSDILFIVPVGMESAYKKIINYSINYYYHSDLYEHSIPLTPTIVTDDESNFEYGMFQSKGIIYKVTKTGAKGIGEVSLIGLTRLFDEYDNSYLSIPSKVEHDEYSYNVTHIAQNGLVGAKAKVIVLPSTITSMDSYILDKYVELLFLSKNCKIIPSNIITDENNESNLQFVSIPFGITTINENAFHQIALNTSSTILPTSIKSVGNKALYQFKLITFLNEKPIKNIKTAIQNGTTVKVDKESMKAYQSAVNLKVKVIAAKNIVNSTKLTLNKSNLALSINKSFALKGTLSKGSNETIYYLSTNPDVVSVSTKGVVKGISSGTAYIVAYTRTSGLHNIVKVTVNK